MLRVGVIKQRSQGGFSLIEVLVATVILSIVGLAIMGAVKMIVTVTGVQDGRSRVSVGAQNYSDALAAAPYVACAKPSDYSPTAIGLGVQADVTITVTSVSYWNGSTPPVEADPAPAQWATAFDNSCATDKGLQRVVFRVFTPKGRVNATTIGVLKRSTTPDAEPDPDPPPGGRPCVISNPARVASTWVNEYAGSRDDNYSSGSRNQEMNLLYLAGSRRFAYLRFNVAPGVTCDNGGTLPAGANIIAAQIRLYTFNIGGLPACGANSCWHVMERVRGAWVENKLTWNNQPCPTGYGESCQPGGSASTILFEHGTGALNWEPRFQRVQNTQLLDDVRAFYASPSSNYGWVIKEACAIPYGKACGSASPGFQLRSSRASDAAQRPTLTVYY